MFNLFSHHFTLVKLIFVKIKYENFSIHGIKEFYFNINIINFINCDFRFGLVFFMILLVLCVCLWKTKLRERSILFGTAQPPYSPLSNKSQMPNSVSILY